MSEPTIVRRTIADDENHVLSVEGGRGQYRRQPCGGFLLRGADHNLAVRMASATGQVNLHEVTDGGHELHRSYRVMAEQNGVDPDDYVLRPCRDPFEVEASDGQ